MKAKKQMDSERLILIVKKWIESRKVDEIVKELTNKK